MRGIKSLATRLKKRRIELGMSKKELSKIIGCREGQIYRWENGVAYPHHKKLVSNIRRFLKDGFKPHFPKESRQLMGIAPEMQSPPLRSKLTERHPDLDSVPSWCILIPTSEVRKMIDRM